MNHLLKLTEINMQLIEKLQEERNKLWEDMKELNDREMNEERTLDATEKESWDKMNDRMSEIDARVSELVDLEEANKKAEENRSFLEDSTTAPVIEAKEEPMETDADIIRSLASGERRSHKFEKRDLTVGSDGGLVPQGFFDQLIAVIDEFAVVRNVATVITTAGGEDIKFPQITANPTATLVTEGSAIGESDPTTSSQTLGAFKYAYITQISSEMLADGGVDIEG